MPKNPNLAKLNEQRLAAIKSPYEYVRPLHLAWCLVRGRTMDQIESANSNPHHFPDLTRIINLIHNAYRPFIPAEIKTEADFKANQIAEEQYKADKAAFCDKIRADLTAWKKQLILTHLTTEATRRKRNALKRSTPRIHPRPRPESLPERKAVA